MACSLPYGKIYHIFFLNDDSESDRCWVNGVIETLNVSGYSSVRIPDDFNSKHSNSLFGNLKTKIEQSAIFAFVISENSEKSKKFIHLLEIAVLSIIQSDDDTPMVPLLLDNTKMPNCVLNMEPLIATRSREKWLSRLIRVVENRCSFSSCEESDEELLALQDRINQILTTKSKRKQEKFRKIVSQGVVLQSTRDVVTTTTSKKRMMITFYYLRKTNWIDM